MNHERCDHHAVAIVKLEAHQRWFLLCCLFELSLLGAAGVYCELSGQTALISIQWRPADVLIGGAAAVPLLGLFRVALDSTWPSLVEVRRFLETVVQPLFSKWTVLQLAVISVLAGFGEEMLFRGALQGGLAKSLGTIPAIAIASALFGICHLVNRVYGLLAMGIGVYFSVLWLFTDNLLTPITTHALYDFVALLHFLRARPRDRNE